MLLSHKEETSKKVSQKGRPADTETDWKSQFINGEKIMSFITEFTKAEWTWPEVPREQSLLIFFTFPIFTETTKKINAPLQINARALNRQSTVLA